MNSKTFFSEKEKYQYEYYNEVDYQFSRNDRIKIRIIYPEMSQCPANKTVCQKIAGGIMIEMLSG